MSRLFSFSDYSVVETVNLAAVRKGTIPAQFPYNGSTPLENGMLVAVDFVKGEISLPEDEESAVYLHASDERVYEVGKGNASFAVSLPNLPRAMQLIPGDKFETNAVDAGDFTSVEAAKHPLTGAKYGVPSATGDIQLLFELDSSTTYACVLRVVDFVSLPNGQPGVRFVVDYAGKGYTPAKSTDNNIYTFSLAKETGPATIDFDAHTIDIEVEFGTSVSALVATFATSPSITSIKVGGTDQVSGTTANDFTSAVTYIVLSESGASQAWAVTVTVAPDDEG